MANEIQNENQNKSSFPKMLLEHPVTGLIISALGLIPGPGPFIEFGVNAFAITLREALDRRQKAKLEKILTDVLECEEITVEDVNNTEAVYKFAQLWHHCLYEISDEKISYMTKLFIGSVKEADSDRYEEYLDKISSLSIREINFLIEFYRIQCDNRTPINNGHTGFNARETWKKVVEHFKANPYGMNETDCLAMASGIQRTGFCLCEWGGLLDGASGFAYIVPEFDKVIDKLVKRNDI